MGRTRKFCGKTTTLWRKCENCEKRESCMQVDKDFIAKGILIDCEGFYYVFKKLEIFEAYPRLDGDVEKHKQDMAEYEERHKGVPLLTPPLVANGTLAAELSGQVDEAEKRRRSSALIALDRELRREILLEVCDRGEPLTVLFEAKGEGGLWHGHSDEFIEVLCESDVPLSGCLASVLPISVSGDAIMARLANIHR